MNIKSLLVTAVISTALLCSCGLAAAQSVDNSALIAQIQAQIDNLTGQLKALKAQQGITPQAWCPTFTKYLFIGSTDATTGGEVSGLQRALAEQGFDASGDAQGIFGDSSAAAVVQLQGKYSITQTGTVGPNTRKILNSLYACNATGTIQPSITVNSPSIGSSYTWNWNYFSIPISWSSDNAYIYHIYLIHSSGRSIEIGNTGGNILSMALTRTTAVQDFLSATPQNTQNGYYIKVSGFDVNGNIISSGQTGWFTINYPPTTNQASITVQAPAGGSYQVGSNLYIQWISNGLSTVSANLLAVNANGTATGNQYGIFSNVNAGNNSYNWTIPASVPAGTYEVFVGNGSSTANSQIFIINSWPIVQSPITVTSPNGGETFAIGESLNVIWNSASPTQPVDVKIINSYGSVALQQLNVTPTNAESQSLGFATSSTGSSYLPLGQYTARVCSAGTNNCDDGNGTFTVIPSVTNVYPYISGVSPQPVFAGSTLTVNIANAGRMGNVLFQTADGSKTWSTGYVSDSKNIPNGFLLYSGSQISFTVPYTIGRGLLPEGTGYESIVPVITGNYKVSVNAFDANNNFISSNMASVQVIRAQ